jgi:hypothetical protein
MKPRSTPIGGYLDPCDPADDVENDIAYLSDFMFNSLEFRAKDPTSMKAVNTANLLNRLHNGHNKETTNATAGLRLAIQKKHYELLNLIILWLDCDKGSTEKLQNQYKIERHLSRKSSFTMLMRSATVVSVHIPQSMLD